MIIWAWIWFPIVMGILLFITSIIATIRIAMREKHFSLRSIINIALIITSICWIAVGVYGFIVIQSQLYL